jgi:23S rRNA (pseudouridine1915-N3)-methyltransferase
MKITFLVVGKTENSYLKEGIDDYEKRLKHYVNFKIIALPNIKSNKKTSPEWLKNKEGEEIIKNFSKSSYKVLLDERGETFSSTAFADFIQKKMNQGLTELIFTVGGAYGFGKQVYEQADMQISLSKMTFSHQMIRLIFVEQLYRAFTIIKNEPYHNE